MTSIFVCQAIQAGEESRRLIQCRCLTLNNAVVTACVFVNISGEANASSNDEYRRGNEQD